MIVTLTPNPSLDLLFSADHLVWDDANRVAMPRRRPGGQGINVVRAARSLDPGVAALAVAPLGGAVGQEMRALLDAEGTPLRAVPIAGETRVFVGVRERGTGRSLLLNPRGPRAGEAEAAALLAAMEHVLDGRVDDSPSAWLACCGSLLPGMPADFYARVAAVARERGVRVVADCDGEALAAAVEGGCDLLVPNEHEAARLLGRRIEGAAAAMAGARELLRRGPSVVVVTLGPAGAVAAAGGDAWHAVPDLPAALADEIDGGSAVGAGDAFLAALLLRLGGHADVGNALIHGVAAGTAALLSRDADLVRPEDVDRILPYVRTGRLVLP